MLFNFSGINDSSPQQYYKLLTDDEDVLYFSVSVSELSSAVTIQLAFQYKFVDCTKNNFKKYLFRVFP